MSILSRTALAAALALILLPAAAAHTTVASPDGRYRVVVGQLDEPVVTYAKTGLDLCFQANNTARTPLSTVAPGALTATLVAPGGERRSQELRPQFGRPGCFQFSAPYVLTVPGQYRVDLAGDLNGTAVDFRGVAAGGEVVDAGDIMFPAAAPTSAELSAELEALRARLQSLEGKATSPSGATSKASPFPAAALVLVALGALAVLRRRAPAA